MRKQSFWLVMAIPVGVFGISGCQSCCPRNNCPPGPVSSAYGVGFVQSSFGTLPPHPLTPCQSCPITPPGQIALGPPAGYAPGVGRLAPPQPAPQQAIQPAWHAPAEPDVRLAIPEAVTPPPSAPVRQPPEQPRTADNDQPPPRSRSGVIESREPSPELPVGIPQFSLLKEKTAVGLKPSLEGLNWLKGNGYRTVLHLIAPGENNGSADRKQIEEVRSLSYRSMEVSPDTLKPELVKQFTDIVSNPENLPLFIYDKDGSRIGALWYLYLRLVERRPDDEARRRAGALGLKPENHDMWLAIQKYLENHPAR